MGNRAVIVSHDTSKDNVGDKIGIYLHWHGSPEDIKMFLNEAKKKKLRTVDDDPDYFWARFVQLIADTMIGTTGVGIGIVSHLDTHNYDNGVYYIKGFDIVKHTDGSEFD